MNKRFALFVAAAVLLSVAPLFAGEKLSDAATREKLLGYWQSPRHAYLFKADGVVYMCPRSICTTTNKWDVKNGRFYWDGEANEILLLTNKKFSYRAVGKSGPTFTLDRTTEKEAEG
jgi:hypothetical protein